MPTYRDDAVVLRTHKLGEADRIVTLLSRQHGKIRAVAKGVRRTGSRFGSRLEPFMVVDAQFHIGRSLDIVQQVESIGAYGADIAGDYARFTAAHAMVEAADRLTEHEAGTPQYTLLVGALRSLSRGEHPPSFDECAVTGAPGPHHAFVFAMGGVVADDVAPPGAPRIDDATRVLLGALLEGNWATVDAASAATRERASGIIAAYTQFHLERGLRALPLVDRGAAS